MPVRVTTAFKRLLRLDGVSVTAVEFSATLIVVTIVLRSRRLVCPHCTFKTRAVYDRRPRPSRWRHLDLGVRRVELRCGLRRLVCPTHGVIVEAVPARHPDLVKRDFSAARPNELWVTDLTYVPTWAGVAYVCFIIDAYSRMIVGWRVAAHMRASMVTDALDMARHARGAVPLCQADVRHLV